ncbi:hypothetical protein AAEX37_01095 [Oligella sp. MSHR50489EDL]|uniref:helix-turn-helix domain-containing protein n=1 Tax=Oligella TaxID=90243 RepID=UPI000CFE8167|nr:helix-turn-helix domain-containing protein [Oligella urethralis]AVL70648.1 hypothetical protein CEQ07_03905 [Oligella urethralis]SUA61563.1 Uncharacterised protein [Oligella urethralis]
MKTVTLTQYELEEMLTAAATAGAKKVFDNLMVYNKAEAAKLLRVSYMTLQKRIDSGHIKTVDGRITGAEISRYLEQEE